MRGRDYIILYVEKYLPAQKIVLADFFDSNEFEKYSSATGLDYPWQQRPTMIEFLNYSQKRVNEGTYYHVEVDVLQSILKRISTNEGSLIVGFKVMLREDDETVFGKSKSFTDNEKIQLNYFLYGRTCILNYKTDYGIKGIDKVVVKNVGQGSCNELWHKKECMIIFDCGTSYSTPSHEVYEMTDNFQQNYHSSRPICIISHWDVDHYHFLLSYSDETIKSFSYFICRNELPTLTARKALGRLKALNGNAIQPLMVVPPQPSKRSGIELHMSSLVVGNFIHLYNGTKNRNRNKSGIGLVLLKPNKCFIFSADFDYQQISNSILDKVRYNCEQYLIVPHHGGKAGKCVYNYSRKNKLKDAIISVGKNSYEHPFKSNIEFLKSLGFNVIQTLLTKEDYIKEL